MAQPFDGAVTLQLAAAALREVYRDGFYEQYNRFGKATARAFNLKPERVVGDGMNIQVESGALDVVRPSLDPLGPFAAPSMITAAKVKIRWNETNPTAHDFTRLSHSTRVSHYELTQNDGTMSQEGVAYNIVKKLVQEGKRDEDEKLAMYRNLDRTGQLASVSSTPTANSANNVAQATGAVSNTTGARFTVSGGSIAFFRQGTRIDVYNGATLIAGNISVTDCNPNDNSIGVQFITAASGVIASWVSTGLLSGIASGHTIFLSGARNQGLYSIGAWFQQVATTGDSFIGGVDRMSAAYRWMIPLQSRIAATAAPLTLSMIDTILNDMAYRSEDELALMFISDPRINQRLRNEYTEARMLSIPDGDNRVKRFANFGSMGVYYQHPTVGMVRLEVDAYANPNTLRGLNTTKWFTASYGTTGLTLMPGDTGAEGFYRMNADTPGTGKGMLYQADAFRNVCDYCTDPFSQFQILNITA